MSKSIHLSAEQKALFKQWMIENWTGDLVPADEGSDEGLLYNLVHWLEEDGKRYRYDPETIEEAEQLINQVPD